MSFQRLPLAVALLLPATAAAQSAPQPASSATRTDSTVISKPKLPDIQDAMLEDLPQARQRLASWRQALGLVRRQSTTLSQSLARVQQARGQARQALAAALPKLTGSANLEQHLLTGTREFNGPTVFQTDPTTGHLVAIPGGARSASMPDPSFRWGAALDLRVPVFAPRAWYDAKTASMRQDVAHIDKAEAERLLLGAVADAIVSNVTAERLLEISSISLRSSLSTLELNRRRREAGTATAIDILRAEQEVAIARAQVVGAQEGVLKAREALGLALGSIEPWSVTPAIDLDLLAEDAGASCQPGTSVDARSDVKAAAATVELARRESRGVDRSFWPTVDATSQLRYHPNREQSPNNQRLTWSVGGLLTWQLYDGGLRYGQRETTQAQLRLARDQLTDTKRRASIEAMQAKRGVLVAESQLSVSRESREVASKSARLARIAFVNGSGTSFDLVDTDRRLREAEVDLAIKEFEVIRAKITALLAVSTCSL